VRYKLTIEYAGTRYSGWQIQKNARTIQGEIDRAVRTVTGRNDFELYGAGRTDAGVHATGQVAHLDVASNLPAQSLLRRLNDELPTDINILAADSVPHRFHARHDAIARRYVYQLARRRTALAKAYVWWIKDPLSTDRMREAARAFVGMRDFKSFAAGGEDIDEPPAPSSSTTAWGPTPRLPGSVPPAPSSLVLIERLDILEDGDLVLVVIEGSHFLWKMVRRMVGVVVEIGCGRLDPAEAWRLLQGGSDLPARLTAPASGLFLERVIYPNDRRDDAVRPATPLRG
jgi:tRNA pseudouridine38-40 synthase